MPFTVKILAIHPVTHDVKSFRFEKPRGFEFHPGQAADVSINKKGMEEGKRPFTFTSLVDDPFLEFTIKRYPDHHGVTDQLHQLEPGDDLIISEPWGAIEYKGPGYFIAGGAGITPFLAILRDLHRRKQLAGNLLFFSNKTEADIIHHKELKMMMGDQAVFIVTKEKPEEYSSHRIDESFLKDHIKDFQKHFYVCGPDAMVADINKTLKKLGAAADTLIFEK